MNLPDKDKILSALAEVWKMHLEAETGRKVKVTIVNDVSKVRTQASLP